MIKTPSQFLTISALVPVIFLSQQQNIQKDITIQQLNEQSVLATNWLQLSGEYRALAYQTFNIAKLIFATAKSKNVNRPAIIVDIDETVLDNSPYQAGLLDMNNDFELTRWNQWIKAGKAKAIPGSVVFVNYVNQNGGKVFFISNRDKESIKYSKNNDLKLATIKNLRDVGFTGVNKQTVLLKGEFTKIISGEEDTSKQWRVEAVKNGSVDGRNYTVVAMIGDNIDDFDETAGKNNQQRRDHVDKNSNYYGMFSITSKGTVQPAYIPIPNPIYGNWETGMYNPQAFEKQRVSEMTPGQRNQQRKESLNRWLPK